MSFRSLEDYAIFIHSLLAGNGYEAYFVGGCVRDILLGIAPKDYDIATNASPEAVMRLFPGSGLVGAHFGVVLVRDGAWQVEVATFRADGDYSDGRRPDSVQFVGDVRADVERRDFTINALLMDPRTRGIVDFVGGRSDLEAGVVRAIGDPRKRFAEDHLRLLRAVRFAARYRFTIEPRTFDAIREMSALVKVVATERVRDEITRILMEGGAPHGLELLEATGLAGQMGFLITGQVLDRFRRGKPSTTPVAWAALLLESGWLAKSFRLSAHELKTTRTLIANHGRVNRPFLSEAERKRFVRLPSHAEQMELHLLDGLPQPELPGYSQEELWPTPFITGDDLLALEIPEGPEYSVLLRAAEDAQLNAEVSTREQALAWLADAIKP